MQFKLGSVELNYDEDFEFFLNYIEEFEELGDECKDFFEKEFADTSEIDPDILYQNIEELTKEMLAPVLDRSIEILIENDIFDYDVERFTNEFEQELDIKNTDEYIHFYEKYHGLLTAREQAEEMKRIRSENNQGSWVGGGFGVKGALKGAVEAKLLNIGSEAIGGIGNAINNAFDRLEISNLKEELAGDPAIKNALMGVLRIFTVNLPICLFSVLSQRTGRSPRIILGNNERETGALFNNLSKIPAEKKQLVIKQILEKEPRSKKYLFHLLTNYDDYGFDLKEVSLFVSTVNNRFYCNYITTSIDELLKDYGQSLPQLDGRSKEQIVESIDVAYQDLKQFGVANCLIEESTDGQWEYSSDDALDNLGFALEFAVKQNILYILAELKWIKYCTENNFGNYDYHKLSPEDYQLAFENLKEILRKHYIRFDENTCSIDPIVAGSFLDMSEEIKENYTKYTDSYILDDLRNAFRIFSKNFAQTSDIYYSQASNITELCQRYGYDKAMIFPSKSLFSYIRDRNLSLGENRIPIAVFNEKDAICITSNDILVIDSEKATAFRPDKINFFGFDTSKKMVTIAHLKEDGKVYFKNVQCSTNNSCRMIGRIMSSLYGLVLRDEEKEKRDYEKYNTLLDEKIKMVASDRDKFESILNDAIEYGVITSDNNIRDLDRPLYKEKYRYQNSVIPILCLYNIQMLYGHDYMETFDFYTSQEAKEITDDISKLLCKYSLIVKNKEGYVLNTKRFNYSKEDTFTKTIKEFWERLINKKECIVNTDLSSDDISETAKRFYSIFKDANEFSELVKVVNRDALSTTEKSNIKQTLLPKEQPLLYIRAYSSDDKYWLMLSDQRFVWQYDSKKGEKKLNEVESVSIKKSLLCSYLQFNGCKEPEVLICSIAKKEKFLEKLNLFVQSDTKEVPEAISINSNEAIKDSSEMYKAEEMRLEKASNDTNLSDTIFCPFCGKKIQRSTKFCNYCGKQNSYNK